MKSKKSLCVIIVGIILIVAGTLLFLKPKEESKAPEPIKDDHENEVVEETIIDSDVTLLIANLISIENSDLSKSFYVYQNKKVTLNDIDSEVIYGNALSSISMEKVRHCTEEELANNSNCDMAIESSNLLEEVKALYGDKYADLPKNINGNMYLSCTLNNSTYECLNHGPEDEVYNDYTEYFGMTNYVNAKAITKAEKSEKYLYIYEKYINLRLDTTNFNAKDLNTYNYSLYKYSNADIKINDEIILGKDYFKTGRTSFGSEVIKKYADVATNYKHTFKKQADGSYIYVSTEEVK